MKKILVSALIAAVCLGLGGTALAATVGVIQPAAFTDIAGHEAEADLTLLAAMGVYSGEAGLGGPVKPEDPITRAQFCKVVVTAMGRGSTASGLAGLQPTFTDRASIPSWAWGYINVAVYMGIINGYQDGSFGPGKNVTYAEAVTMLIRALAGHKEMVGPGIWPYNYLFYGVDNDFTGGVDAGFCSLPATRGDIAQMLVATMQIEKLTAKGDKVPDSARIYPIKGTVAEYDADHVILAGGPPVAKPLGPKVWLVGSKDYEGLRNLPVWMVADKDGVLFAKVTGDSNTVVGVFDSIDDDTDHYHAYIVLDDNTKVPYAPDKTNSHTMVDATVNLKASYHEWDLNEGDEVIIALGDDGLAVNVVATRFVAPDWVKTVAPSKNYKDTDKATWTQVDTNGDAHYDVDSDCALSGGPAKPDNLAKFDVISVAKYQLTGDPYIIRVHREVVEGTVYSTSTTYPNEVHRVTIDLKNGTRKTYVLSHGGGIGSTFPMPGEKDTVKYGLDFNGKIFTPIGYETLTPYVLVKSYTTGTAGNLVTVDVRGTETTYTLATGASLNDTDVGCLGKVGLNLGNNQILTFTHADFTASPPYDVLSVDPTGATMTVRAAAVEFIKDPVVYEWDEDTEGFVYVPYADIALTWSLWKDQLAESKLYINGPMDWQAVVNLDLHTNYTTIQAAVDAAASGNHIVAGPGTYVENPVLDKTNMVGLTLTSASKHQAVIEGTVTITVNNVTLADFSIKKFSQNPTPDWSGVYIPSGTGVVVSRNLIDGTTQTGQVIGVQTVYNGSAGVTVSGNTIRNVNMGVYNQGATMTVSGNLIENARHCGIGVDRELGTTITGNTIRECHDMGIEVFRNAVTIHGNTFGRATGVTTCVHVWMADAVTDLNLVTVISGNTFPNAVVTHDHTTYHDISD